MPIVLCVREIETQMKKNYRQEDSSAIECYRLYYIPEKKTL